MNVYERLLKYVVIRTSSNEESDTTPPPSVNLTWQMF